MITVYRPEIDGLRTISVMLVILHHLGWTLFSGGYIGVDVFFVISGYLITNVVMSEVKEGRFSFSNFYKRRVIRLAPAYFLVLLVVSIIGAALMLPAELVNYFESVKYSTVFLANFYMWKEVGGYFAANADVIPLLHLWSLAVEEQFYVLWPFTFIFLYKVIPQRFFLGFMLVIAILGVCISEWGVYSYRAAAYYLMPTRAYELLMGALLVFLPQRNWRGTTRNVMGLVGLALIFLAAITYTTGKMFPGVNGVLPCLGAALVLVFCSGANDLCGRLLASAPMTMVGRISYPAYLWHWPIIAFLNVYLVKIDLIVGLGVIIFTLLISAMTYYYVESPAKRFNKKAAGSVVVLGFLLPATVFVGAAFVAGQQAGWPDRFQDSINKKSEALLSYSHKVRGRCNEGNVVNPLPADRCVLGIKNRPVDFLMIGDSHANHFTGMVDVIAKDAGLRGYDITQSNTVFLPYTKSFYFQDGERVEYKNFEARNNTLIKKIEEDGYRAVVLAGSFATHYNSGDFEAASEDAKGTKVFEQQFEEAVRLIQTAGAVVVVVKGNPLLGDIPADCPLVNARFGFSNRCDVALQTHQAYFRKWDALLKVLSLKYPKMVVIDPAEIMCNQKDCLSEIDGLPLYRDGNHLNHLGSELIGRRYIEKFGNPLLSIRDVSEGEQND